MTRRALLAMLAGAVGVAVADPERLLWVPGRKLISIPPAPLVYPPLVFPEWYLDMVSRDVMLGVRRQLLMADADRQYKIGNTLQLRRPPRWEVLRR